MSTSTPKDLTLIDKETLESMLLGFNLAEAPVFVAKCCNRVFMGSTEPAKCRTCPSIPKALKVSTTDELEQAVLFLNA